MRKMTISEAMAELKTLDKRITKKTEFVLQNCTSTNADKDMYVEEGGIKKVLERELQAIDDLSAEVVRIKTAITEANLKKEVTINGETKTVAGWLSWRRERASQDQKFYNSLANQVNRAVNENNTRPRMFEDSDGTKKILTIESNVNMGNLNNRCEGYEAVLGQLDGKLSLVNATTVINF